MSEQLSLTTRQRLKAAGYPQDHWPQMVWVPWTWKIPHRLLWGINAISYPGHVTCPPIITADGKAGVLPWLHGKGVSPGFSATRNFFYDDALECTDCDSPEALIIAALDQMEATQ